MWNNSKKNENTQIRRNETINQKGSSTILCIFILWISLILGLGILAVYQKWQKTVELQWRLDQCVGKHLLFLKNKLNKIESINSHIKKIRVSIQVAERTPYTAALAPALRVTLEALVISQELELKKWSQKQINFLTFVGCSEKQGYSFTFPIKLPLWRGVRDSIGPLPLKWIITRQSFKVHSEIKSKNRSTAARLVLNKKKDIFTVFWSPVLHHGILMGGKR